MTYRLNVPPNERRPEKLEAVATQAATLLALSGRVYVDDKFVAMATHLGDGFWVTCYDRIFVNKDGIPNLGKAYDPPGHVTIDGMNVEWSVELPLRPLLLMKVPVSTHLDPSAVGIASMADLCGGYTKIWRIGYQEMAAGFAEPQPDQPPFLTEGTTLELDVSYSWFRNGADPIEKQSAFNTHVNFEYPGRTDLGAPVVFADGRLVAVIIGADLGPQSSHQAAITPVELILPFLNVWRRRVEAVSKGKFHFSIHHGIIE